MERAGDDGFHAQAFPEFLGGLGVHGAGVLEFQLPHHLLDHAPLDDGELTQFHEAVGQFFRYDPPAGGRAPVHVIEG